MQKIDEKWYAQDGSEIKRVVRIITIILIIAAAVWGVGLWMNAQRVPQLPGEVILKGNMSFEGADAKVQEAGYVPRSEVLQKGSDYQRYYESSEVFGKQTVVSTLMLIQSQGRYVSFDHLFPEEDNQHNAENPGPVFNAILEELTSCIGTEPRKQKSDTNGTILFWELQEKTGVGLFYFQDNLVRVRYIYVR